MNDSSYTYSAPASADGTFVCNCTSTSNGGNYICIIECPKTPPME